MHDIDPTLPEHLIRRDFLKKLAAASTAAWMTGAPQAIWAKTGEKVTHPPAKADACILLWMAGGMAAPDTFDPKGYLPFELSLIHISFHNDHAWGEKLWIMHRDMALRLLKDRPGKKIMMTSYGPTIQPPETFREFPENTIIEMMHSDAEAFAAWKQLKVPGGFSAYLYNWGNFHLVGLTPLTTVGMIEEQNRLLVGCLLYTSRCV